jgi:hypothetical protein
LQLGVEPDGLDAGGGGAERWASAAPRSSTQSTTGAHQ